MDAIANIARKQIVGKSGEGIGRKKTLRRSEVERMVRKGPLRGAFNRLKRSPSSAAGTATQVHHILKYVRGKTESSEGLKVKMRSGHEYVITESTDVEKGRLGMKQAARGAVREEVEEVQEQREELAAREQEKAKEGELSAGEKRRQEAKQKQSAWRKGEFGTIGENAESAAPSQTSAAPMEMNVSISEQHEDARVGMSDDDTDDSDSGGGVEDMPIA